MSTAAYPGQAGENWPKVKERKAAAAAAAATQQEKPDQLDGDEVMGSEEE